MQSETGAAFDAVAADYDADYEHAHLAEALVRLIAPTALDLVLDVGTGTGAAAFAALRRLAPARIIAIDISAGMLRVARQRAAIEDPERRIDWRHGHALPLPLDADSADLVLCTSSLHFLGRPALTDWQRVLRPGGRVAFTLPTASSFNPSPPFERLLPADRVRLPADRSDAHRILEGTGLQPLQIAVEQLRHRDRTRQALLLVAKMGTLSS